jgi:hypothetical protein
MMTMTTTTVGEQIGSEANQVNVNSLLTLTPHFFPLLSLRISNWHYLLIRIDGFQVRNSVLNPAVCNLPHSQSYLNLVIPNFSSRNLACAASNHRYLSNGVQFGWIQVRLG